MSNADPELDETTAIALHLAIENHIKALQAWQRKLQQPYLPTSNKVYSIHRITPLYPKPTLASALHILTSCSQLRTELGRIVTAYVAGKQLEES